MRLELERSGDVGRHVAGEQVFANDLRFPGVDDLLDLHVRNARFFFAGVEHQLRLFEDSTAVSAAVRVTSLLSAREL